MEERTGYLKYIFSIECFLGTSVVSYKTIGQNPEHRVSRYVWLLVLMILVIFDIFFNLKEVNAAIGTLKVSFIPFYAHRIVRDLCILYTSYMALYKEDKKLYTALHLEAIEEYLGKLNIALPGGSAETSVLLIFGILYLFHLGEVVALMFNLVVLHKEVVSLQYIGMLLYSNSVKCSQMFGCVLLLTRCLRIQQALNKKLEILGLQCEEKELPVVAVVQRRVAWAEGTEDRQRVLDAIKAVYNVLAITEREVRSSYRVFLVWITFVSAVYTPYLTLLFVYKGGMEVWGMAFTMMVYPAFCMAVVVMDSLMQYGKQSIEDKLAKLLSTESHEECSRSIRHQLRAFNSDESYDCALFDVDYPLMATILETTLMVVCTVVNARL